MWLLIKHHDVIMELLHFKELGDTKKCRHERSLDVYQVIDKLANVASDTVIGVPFFERESDN